MELNEYELAAQQELEREKQIGEVKRSGLTLEQIRLEKEARFKSMGVPIPMPVIQPHMIKNVNNPSALSKIEEIKRGAKKNLFTKIEAISEGKLNTFQEIPVTQPSQNQQRNKNQNTNLKRPGAIAGPPPKILTFDVPSAIQDPALLAIMENMNNTDTSSNGVYSNTPSRDDSGAEFISNFKGKLHNKLKDKATTVEQNNYTQFAQQGQSVAAPTISTTSPILTSGMVLIDENDLKKKIYAISQLVIKKEVAKIVDDAIKLTEQKFTKSLFDVKNILNEYLKIPKNVIIESDKVKKAEVVGENIVKIDGKFYKLAPVILKKKE